METWQEESPLFSAPLVPGPASWVQTYYQLTLWITPFLFLGVLIAFIVGWPYLSVPWLGFWMVVIPICCILFHFGAVRWLARMDLQRRNRHKIQVGKESLTVFHANGEIEQFPIPSLTQLRWMYSGYERAWRKKGTNFSGHENQLTFRFRDRSISLQFRLVSKAHSRNLVELLKIWYEDGHSFEEFNKTSGLPLQSHLLLS